MADKTDTRPRATHIAVSPNRSVWARGMDVADAKTQCKRFGGNLNNVIVFALPPRTHTAHVDNFGAISWMWDTEVTDDERAELGKLCVEVYRRGVKN